MDYSAIYISFSKSVNREVRCDVSDANVYKKNAVRTALNSAAIRLHVTPLEHLFSNDLDVLIAQGIFEPDDASDKDNAEEWYDSHKGLATAIRLKEWLQSLEHKPWHDRPIQFLESIQASLEDAVVAGADFHLSFNNLKF